jgi:hypothetical protein
MLQSRACTFGLRCASARRVQRTDSESCFVNNNADVQSSMAAASPPPECDMVEEYAHRVLSGDAGVLAIAPTTRTSVAIG